MIYIKLRFTFCTKYGVNYLKAIFERRISNQKYSKKIPIQNFLIKSTEQTASVLSLKNRRNFAGDFESNKKYE